MDEWRVPIINMNLEKHHEVECRFILKMIYSGMIKVIRENSSRIYFLTESGIIDCSVDLK